MYVLTPATKTNSPKTETLQSENFLTTQPNPKIF